MFALPASNLIYITEDCPISWTPRNAKFLYAKFPKQT